MTIAISPATTMVSVGQEFTVDVVVQTGSQPVAAVDAFLDFDPAFLQVVSITPDPGTLPTILISTFNNTLGQITYSAGKQLGGADVSGTFRLATVRLKALASTGGTGLVFVFQPPTRDTDVFYQGVPVLDSATDGNIMVDAIHIPLETGWNLISLPVEPASASVTSVLAGIANDYDLAYTYIATDTGDAWKKYNIHAPFPILNDLTEIHEGMGVWVRVSQPVTLTLSGALPASSATLLKVGWNLVGYRGNANRPVSDAMETCSGKWDIVYTYVAGNTGDPWKTYDVSAPASSNLTTMEIGRGYWIHMTQECVWTP